MKHFSSLFTTQSPHIPIRTCILTVMAKAFVEQRAQHVLVQTESSQSHFNMQTWGAGIKPPTSWVDDPFYLLSHSRPRSQWQWTMRCSPDVPLCKMLSSSLWGIPRCWEDTLSLQQTARSPSNRDVSGKPNRKAPNAWTSSTGPFKAKEINLSLLDQQPYKGNSQSKAHDHRWELKCRSASKSKALPSSSTFSPLQQSSATSACQSQGDSTLTQKQDP